MALPALLALAAPAARQESPAPPAGPRGRPIRRGASWRLCFLTDISNPKAPAFFRRARRWIDTAAGGLYLLLGARLALNR